MGWFFVILLLSLVYGSVSDVQRTPAVVVGTVYCDICSQHDITPKTPFISGAKVGVECKVPYLPIFRKEVETDKHGEFKVKLPFRVWKHAKRIKECRVKLISSSEPHCNVPSLSTSSSVSLIATKQGELIFSAGLLSFKPIEKLGFCNRKQSVPNPSEMNSLVDDYAPVFPPPPFKPVTPGPIEHPAPPKHH